MAVFCGGRKGGWIRTHLNATIRWTVAHARPAGHDTLIIPLRGDNANRIRPPPPEKCTCFSVISLTENCIKQLAGRYGLPVSIYVGLGMLFHFYAIFF